MKIIYHRADLDGKCSAAILFNEYPFAELVPWNYGELLPETVPGGNETVYMVDCCPNDINYLSEYNENVNLVWIDHHGDKIADAKKIGFNPLGIRKEGLGACALVWEWMHPGEGVPWPVLHLAMYDVWDHSHHDTLPFQFAMRSVNNDPDSQVWKNLIKDEDDFFDSMIGTGHVMLDYQKQQWAIYVKTCSFTTDFMGLKVLACNSMLANSMLFDSIWDNTKWDAMLTFGWRKGKWMVSLYTDKEGLNLGADYAKKCGGGGHPGAAGFSCDELPFLLNRD